MTPDETALLHDVGVVLDGVPTDTVLTVLSHLMAATIAFGAQDIQEADELVGSVDIRLKTIVRHHWNELRQARFEVTVGGRA